MKKNIHIISHSHWDREWYMPFEYHRAKLVELIDDCIELIENDKDFACFNLDGHTVLIEDYLEIKPYNREKLKKYISEGRITVGPWYVLQDEFLTSSESNIRNLLVGMSVAKEFGKVNMVGYFPDSFGNVEQMPQILKQAGMKAIYFGRGVKPTGAANQISDFDEYNPVFSEMFWKSPDGSKLPAILFANWYNNGMEIPSDGNQEYWDSKIKEAEKYASTNELLIMNGCDHQPVQKDLSMAIKTASQKYPEYNFIHSDFEKYADAVMNGNTQQLDEIAGELTSQDTDGWGTLVGTCSSHAYLKSMNRRSEILLESVAEPLSVIASEMGMSYPHDMLLYSWKTLMKNHPHDSICGCSIDAVNNEMYMRFIKSNQCAQTIIDNCLSYISKHIKTDKFNHCKATFAVINTFSMKNSGVISVNVDIERIYGTGGKLTNSACEINKREEKEYILVDEYGTEIPCTVKHNSARFGYDLPDDKFRQPYMAENVIITFMAQDIPAMGFKTYGLEERSSDHCKTSMITGPNKMENENLSVEINSDGTVNLTDKKTGRKFKNILRYEDVGDNGNEYMFMPATDDKPILSGNNVQIQLVTDEEYMAEYKITTVMNIPESAEDDLQKQIYNYVEFADRKASRGKKLVPVSIDTHIILEKDSNSLKVKTELINTAKNHRLRVLIPTGLRCNEHKAGSVFESVSRANVHKKCWTYPSGCERQQMFVLMNDDVCGITVSNIGMYEYEILKDNTIALTLFRAVGDLGDWGVFPTTLSQCLREMSFEYQITPFSNEKDAYEASFAMQYPLQSVQMFDNCNEDCFENEFLWRGEMLFMTAFKGAQDRNDIIMRWVNYSDKKQTLSIHKTKMINNLYISNVVEHKGKNIADTDGIWTVDVEPYQIVTLGCERD